MNDLPQSEEHVKCMLYVSFFGSLVARKKPSEQSAKVQIIDKGTKNKKLSYFFD